MSIASRRLSGGAGVLDALHPQAFAYYGFLARWDQSLAAAVRTRFNQFFIELDEEDALSTLARIWVVGANLGTTRIDLITGERARIIGTGGTFTANVSLRPSTGNGIFTQCSPLSLAVEHDKYAAASKHISAFKVATTSAHTALGAQLLAGGAVRNYMQVNPTSLDVRMDGDGDTGYAIASATGHFLFTMNAQTGHGAAYHNGVALASPAGSGQVFNGLVDGPWGLGGMVAVYDSDDPSQTQFQAGDEAYFAWTMGGYVNAAQAAVISGALSSLRDDLPGL